MWHRTHQVAVHVDLIDARFDLAYQVDVIRAELIAIDLLTQNYPFIGDIYTILFEFVSDSTYFYY